MSETKTIGEVIHELEAAPPDGRYGDNALAVLYRMRNAENHIHHE